ncbi:hypothetical protein FB451DRAFT_1179218 [Mycena latifolia]|nr:hypothetical protein FB451DRAFT_1179218 [Mycena latifolia]
MPRLKSHHTHGDAAAFTKAPPPALRSPPPFAHECPRQRSALSQRRCSSRCGLGTPTRRAFMGPTAAVSVHPRPSSVSRTTRAAAVKRLRGRINVEAGGLDVLGSCQKAAGKGRLLLVKVLGVYSGLLLLMSEEKPEYDSEVYMICGIDAPPVRRPLQIAIVVKYNGASDQELIGTHLAYEAQCGWRGSTRWNRQGSEHELRITNVTEHNNRTPGPRKYLSVQALLYTTVPGLLHNLVAELTVAIFRLAAVELKGKWRSSQEMNVAVNIGDVELEEELSQFPWVAGIMESAWRFGARTVQNSKPPVPAQLEQEFTHIDEITPLRAVPHLGSGGRLAFAQ